jgi:hypothetical protein
LLEAFEFARLLGFKISSSGPDLTKFPVNFPVSRKFASEDRFDLGCVRHHQISLLNRNFLDFRGDATGSIPEASEPTSEDPNQCNPGS